MVPAHATSSSNAILCGSAMILREAIIQADYDWSEMGGNLPEAMMKIFKNTGRTLHDPATGLTFKQLNLIEAVDFIFADVNATR